MTSVDFALVTLAIGVSVYGAYVIIRCRRYLRPGSVLLVPANLTDAGLPYYRRARLAVGIFFVLVLALALSSAFKS